jgi:tRNA(fMet)-specific endonuclease VapC
VTLRFLLDTSVVSAPVSKKPSSQVIKRLEEHGHESAIAAPVWHELTYGCSRLPRGRRRDAIDTYLHDVVKASFPILAYDEAAADWHGRERARLEALGRTVPFVDGQIASIAQVNGLTLVTFNVKDFVRFKDLSATNWTA